MNLLVAAWIGSPNAGDELVFRALSRKLRMAGHDVTAISLDPQATQESDRVSAVASRQLPGVVSAIRRADGVVFGGGGLLQDETSHLNLPYHLSRIWTSRATGTPFAAVGLGVGRLGSRFARWIVRTSLHGHRGIAVRDRSSSALLASLGIRGVVTAADLVFSLPLPDVEPGDRLAVCLRSWPRSSRGLPMSLRWRSDLDREGLLQSLASSLDGAAEATGLEARFVAFHHGRDDVLHRRVADRMRTSVSFAEPGPETLLAEMGSARATITMRYHGGVLAAMHGRPAVLIGGSAKMRSLAEDLGSAGAPIPGNVDSLPGMPSALEEVLSTTEAAREAAELLRARERGNDEVLDRLLA